MMSPYPFFGVPNFNKPYPYYRTYNNSHNRRENFIRQPQNPISPSVCKQKEQENVSCSNNTNKNTGFSPNKQNKSNSSSYNNYSNQHNEKDDSFSNNYQSKNNNFSCNSNHINTDNYTTTNNINNFDDFSEECFEIFGLKLYFDDLLIIALLFFLYQEDVKDTYLYISLILLLLS